MVTGIKYHWGGESCNNLIFGFTRNGSGVYLEISLALSGEGGNPALLAALCQAGLSISAIQYKEPGIREATLLATVTEQVAELEWKPRSLPPEPGGFFSLCGKHYGKDLLIMNSVCRKKQSPRKDQVRTWCAQRRVEGGLCAASLLSACS